MNIEPACPICSDLQKNFASLTKHLKKKHDLISANDLEQCYIQFIYNGQRPTCKCGCGSFTQWYGWKKGYVGFVLGHNGSIYKFLDASEASAIAEKRAIKLRGTVGWSKGLTKETSSSLAKGAKKRSVTVSEQFASGDRIQWSKGLTKETSEGIMSISTKAKERFASGEQSAWHKGKTKETDERVMQMAKNLRNKYASGELRQWHKGLTSENHPGLKKLSDSLKISFKKNDSYGDVRLSIDEIKMRLKQNVTSLTLVSDIASYKNNFTKNLIFSCNKCGTMSQRSLSSVMSNRCWTCQPMSISTGQLEITDFVKSLGFPALVNDRTTITPYELDVLIPGKKLAIEYNGLYWHSESFRGPEYHVKKTKACRRAGLRLLHIFEDEWRDRRPIAESMIRHRLGVTGHKIGARECQVVALTVAQRRSFFEETHIDGDVASSCAFGLMHEGKLVAAMSLRKPRQVKHAGSIEVARFSSALNTSVSGALSKLLKAAKSWAAENDFKKIMTYVDIRHGDGASYVKSGFVMESVTTARYWWSDDVNRYDRFKYRANRELGLSESQVALDAGVTKIWGCPNIVLSVDV